MFRRGGTGCRTRECDFNSYRMETYDSIKKAAEAVSGQVLLARRTLHSSPELSFEERETSRYVANCLREAGIEFRPIAGTGILARIEGRGDLRRCVVLRADMDALPIEENFIGNCSMFTMDEKRRLLRDGLPCTRPQTLTKPIYERVQGLDDVTKMQYLDINVWLVGDILLKADRMSMANSLELRVPFLDKEVFAVASRLPRRLRVNKENTKYAMRKAAMRHLPQATAQKKKLGFPVPTRVWLREEKYYRIVREAFESETARKFFNTSALVALLDDHYHGKHDNNRKIWTIYVFLVWYNLYFKVEP